MQMMYPIPPMTNQSSTHQTVRRSEADLRNEHLEKGALLLKCHFNQPETDPVVCIWRSIEKKGFIVTLDGCLIPHKVHWLRSRARHEGAHVSLLIDGRTVDASTERIENQFGWPINEQMSHLCHDSNCANPQHITVEPQWKNQKRNYCGASGNCDCGMMPKCIRVYQSSHTYEQHLDYSTPELSTRISALLPAFTRIELHQSTFYTVEDTKRRNRVGRKNRAKKHRKQALKKQSRSVKKDSRYFV